MNLSSTALELLQNASKCVFTSEQIHELHKPSVYAFVKAGEVLYVGLGKHGIGRVVDPKHHRAAVRDAAEEVHVFRFLTYREALNAETLLIRELRPFYNKFGKTERNKQRIQHAEKRRNELKCKSRATAPATVAPLSMEEIAAFRRLPSLTLEQIGRMLQKTPAQVLEMTRARAARPLPVFRSGRTLSSTYQKIQEWIDAGFARRAA